MCLADNKREGKELAEEKRELLVLSRRRKWQKVPVKQTNTRLFKDKPVKDE